MAIGLFIDGAYVYKVFQPYDMDYKKLRDYVEAELNDEIDEGYFFNAEDESPKAQRLHNAIAYPPPDGPGLRVKIYWLHKRPLYWPRSLGGMPVMHPEISDLQYEIKTQKAVDVGLVYHMVRSFHKRKWNKLVLAAGDADFYEPVQHLVETEGVDLYLVGSINTISQEIRPYARKILEVDKDPLNALFRRENPHHNGGQNGGQRNTEPDSPSGGDTGSRALQSQDPNRGDAALSSFQGSR